MTWTPTAKKKKYNPYPAALLYTRYTICLCYIELTFGLCKAYGHKRGELLLEFQAEQREQRGEGEDRFFELL